MNKTCSADKGNTYKGGTFFIFLIRRKKQEENEGNQFSSIISRTSSCISCLGFVVFTIWFINNFRQIYVFVLQFQKYILIRIYCERVFIFVYFFLVVNNTNLDLVDSRNNNAPSMKILELRSFPTLHNTSLFGAHLETETLQKRVGFCLDILLTAIMRDSCVTVWKRVFIKNLSFVSKDIDQNIWISESIYFIRYFSN